MHANVVNLRCTRLQDKMSHTIFTLLIVVAVISTVWCGSPPQDEYKKCGKNEEWTNCGSLCPPSCGPKKSTACADVCVKGCQCKRGYLRNSRNECVRPCQCDC